MAIPLSKFWREFVLPRIPAAHIRFRSEHPLLRFFTKGDTIWCIKRTVWFPSRDRYKAMFAQGSVDPLLAHEFTHMWQKDQKYVTWMGYWWPQSSLIFTIPLAFLYESPIFAVFALIFACFPWYAKRRIQAETEAYKSALLMDMIQLYLRLGDPDEIAKMYYDKEKKLHYAGMYAWMPFLRTYWSMWTPGFIKGRYIEEMEDFFGHVIDAFRQLAFVRENSYIITVGVHGIHREIFNHYLRNSNRL